MHVRVRRCLHLLKRVVYDSCFNLDMDAHPGIITVLDTYTSTGFHKLIGEIELQ